MTLKEALKEAGYKVRRTGKRWPRRRGEGVVSIEIDAKQFKPGTGFALSFTMTSAESKKEKK
jgi:hypothetical protein